MGTVEETISEIQRDMIRAHRETAVQLAYALQKALKPMATEFEVERLMDALEDFLG